VQRLVALPIIVLGIVTTLLGETGVFAVFEDRASTGENVVTSGARPRAVDIKIAPAVVGLGLPTGCATFTDDLTTGFFTVDDVQPSGTIGGNHWFCLRNDGSTSAAISALVVDLVDTEQACTGDEAAAGDDTCGTGSGELSAVLDVSFTNLPGTCRFVQSTVGMSGSLASLTVPKSLPNTGGTSLAPGEIQC
jgi:hypothetical protein